MKGKQVVVIGAGLGGLSAAAHLAKNGFGVDVFERNNTPGGYATSFVRGGYEFEASLHELSGIGPEHNRGSCYRVLEACDVARRVQFLPIGNLYTSIFPDLRATVPSGWAEAEEAFSEQFPRERKGINRLMSFMHSLSEEMKMLKGEMSLLDMIAFPVRGSHVIRSTGLTVSQGIDREISDPGLKALFCNIWGYYGLPPSRLSFSLFLSGNASYFEYGPYHVKGTSQALSNAFVASIEEHGGAVHLRNGIRKIEMSGRKVSGVITERGDSVPADYIVSNANPIHCCYGLIGRDHVPPGYLKALARGNIGISTFNVYMGLDCRGEDLGLTQHEFFINDDYDLDEHYRTMFRIEKQKYWVITNYNVSDPEFSPPGTSVVVITALQDYGSWSRVPPERYVETKKRMAEEMINAANHVFPGLKDHIAVLEISTPLTNMRYSNNPGGSMIGFDYDVTASPIFRLGNRGPLKGLYFANAWVRIGGGFEPCITSGYLASADIMKNA